MCDDMSDKSRAPIATKMSDDDIKLFRDRKAYYDECKKNGIKCTLEDVALSDQTKHDIWLTFLHSPLKCYIVEGRIVIRPDDEGRTAALLDESRANNPDEDEEDKEYYQMLLGLVKTGIQNLYIIPAFTEGKTSGMEIEDPEGKTSGMEIEDLPNNNSHPIQNAHHTCVVSGNENSLTVAGDVNVGNIKRVTGGLGGLM